MDADGFDKLLDRARGGGREALEEILRLVRPYTARVAHDLTDRSRPSQGVSDLIQEAELRAWGSSPFGAHHVSHCDIEGVPIDALDSAISRR